jgi:hypothetical protein
VDRADAPDNRTKPRSRAGVDDENRLAAHRSDAPLI